MDAPKVEADFDAQHDQRNSSFQLALRDRCVAQAGSHQAREDIAGVGDALGSVRAKEIIHIPKDDDVEELPRDDPQEGSDAVPAIHCRACAERHCVILGQQNFIVELIRNGREHAVSWKKGGKHTN